MNENASRECERKKVCHCKSCRDIEGGVVVVSFHIKGVLGCQDPRDVVLEAELVIENVVRDGEMR